MSATDLQNQGQQAFKRGEFEKALQYFDRALGRHQTVKLYDYRAATRDKLNDLPAALQDAKKAIHAGDGDPTGYIRAGDILVKMKKPTVALDIYAHGVRKVQHVGQGYERLKKLHDDLQAQIAPQNSVDPLTRLPPEMACMVLDFLTFRQRVVICRVSKGWQKFIRSQPTLWQHLDLSTARKKVRTAFVSTAINAGKSKLTAATLHRLFDHNKVLAALVKHCPLEKLTLADTPSQGQSLVDSLTKATKLKELRVLQGTSLPPSLLGKVAQSCQSSLEVLSCEGLKHSDAFRQWSEIELPRLTSLDMTFDSYQCIHRSLLISLANCPSLRTLRLYSDWNIGGPLLIDLRGRTNLLNVDLELEFSTCRQILLPPSVRTLRLCTPGGTTDEFWSPDGVGSQNDAQLRLCDLPHLEEFSLGAPTHDFEEMREQLAATPVASDSDPPLSMLHTLALDRPCFDAKTFKGLLCDRTKDLEVLKIRECSEFDDKHLLRLVKDFPKLRSLDVTGSDVTGAGIKDVVLLGHIKELVLEDCRKLGRDAVDWARKQGVRVQYTPRRSACWATPGRY